MALDFSENTTKDCGTNMDKIFYPSMAAAICAVMGALTYKTTFEITAMQSNISAAIEKGIDPVAVRCAYASKDDNICVAYAITHGSTPSVSEPPPAPRKK